MTLSQPAAAAVFDALGDSTRRSIIDQLSAGPASVSALAEPLGVSLAGVLQHLQVLEGAELVSSEKLGRVRTCRLSHAGFEVAESWLASRRAALERKLDRLAEILDEPPDQPA